MVLTSHINFIVSADDDGIRIDRVIATHQRAPQNAQNALASLSRQRIQALIKQSQASIIRNAQTYIIDDPAWQVKSGDEISLTVPPLKQTKLTAQAIPLNVLYEDDSLIVLNKPAGLVVHPAPGNIDYTLVNALMAHCGESLSGISGERRPGIVHRLDKNTSGVMVAAKHDMAHQSLAAQFATHGRDGRLSRAYEAFIWGRPVPIIGKIETAMQRHPKARKKMRAVKKTTKARRARHATTHYVTKQSWDDPPLISHIECVLETGRTHQIRVHMAHIGCPIIGDQIYGRGQMSRLRKLPPALADCVKTLNRQALHARLLAFEHPATGESMRFEAPLPDDMLNLAHHLQNELKASADQTAN